MSDLKLYLGEVIGEELGTVVKSSSDQGCFRQTGRTGKGELVLGGWVGGIEVVGTEAILSELWVKNKRDALC